MSEDGASHQDVGENPEDEVKKVEKRWQGRFDKLLQEKKDLEKRLDEQAAKEDTRDADLEARQQYLDRKERLVSGAIERGQDPSKVLELVMGDDDDTRLDALNSMVDEEAQTRTDAEVKKRFGDGPKPKANYMTPSMPSYSELQQMSEAELQSMPREMTQAVIRNERESKSQTVRGRVGRLLGGK